MLMFYIVTLHLENPVAETDTHWEDH